MQLTVRARPLAGACLAVVLTAIAGPAAAAPAPLDVASAQQNLAQAQVQAAQAGTALGAVQQQLAGAQAQLAAIQARVVQLDATLAADNARLARLRQQVADDKVRLAAYVRSVYKSGGAEGALAYLIAAADLGDVFQRAAEMDRVDRAGQTLLGGIASAQAATAAAIAAAGQARAGAEAARAQAATAEAVVAIEAEQVAATATAANATLSTARSQYSAAQQAAAQQAAAAQAAAAAAAGPGPVGPVVPPKPGAPVTVDTDLTQPSGESAPTLNSFLSGTALAGLGGSFMAAEHAYHVSARYLAAHAILESAWGTSAIARDKHNLFGYGADDANPYGDAKSFPTFDACIQFVAHAVAVNYLSPSGAFYHGPTLRGMNVDYASDPGWASKIARIASTIPV